MCNKDFLKEVLAGDKKLFELKEVQFVNIPLYDELSVVNLWPMVQEAGDLMMYFPRKLPKGRLPDREYFFNVLNTLNHEYVNSVVQHANEMRNTAADQGQ